VGSGSFGQAPVWFGRFRVASFRPLRFGVVRQVRMGVVRRDTEGFV
jgi:hypothetical protein